MRLRAWWIAWSFLLACASSGPGSESEANDESDATAEDSDGDTETSVPTPCSEESCDSECALLIDDCGEPMVGWCDAHDGSCHCYDDEPCIDCESDLDCDQWEQCHPEFGCTICFSSWDIAWDPALDCGLDLSDFPPQLAPYVVVELGLEELPYSETCDSEPAGWTWLADQRLSLCPDACAEFENLGSLVLGVGCPGGP